MKKLIVIILLLIAGVCQSQTYHADTLRYFEDVDNTVPDTTLVEDIIITIDKGTLDISKHNANFKAIITDTLSREVLAVGVYMDRFTIRTVASLNGYIYTLELLIVRVDGVVRTIALSRGTQLFLYHITNELIDGHARKQTYFRDWTRTVLGE